MKTIINQTGKELLATAIVQKGLLACGILSTSLYIVMNVLTVRLYKGYSVASQTVSELSAIDAPTRQLWVSLAIIYSMLVIAFGSGICQSAATSNRLRMAGNFFKLNGFIGFFWPPMHQREVLAAGGSTLTDTLHIIFTVATVCLMMLSIGFAAAAIKKWFRIYSIITLLLLVVFGIFTSIESPNINAGLPTPWIGVWERLNIGVYMLWVVVLAIVLLKRNKLSLNNQVPV